MLRVGTRTADFIGL